MKQSKFLWITGILGTLCILGGLYFSFFSSQNNQPSSNQKVASTTDDSLVIKKRAQITIGTTTIIADIADTVPIQRRGLGGRTSLTENQGMLFIFDLPEKYAFWMKDMLIPIDMIWLDQNLKVVYVKNNVSPDTYPETFAPQKPANYVLEVAAGFAGRHSLKIGDTLKLAFPE